MSEDATIGEGGKVEEQEKLWQVDVRSMASNPEASSSGSQGESQDNLPDDVTYVYV